MLTRFDTIHQRDSHQTDRHRMTAQAALMQQKVLLSVFFLSLLFVWHTLPSHASAEARLTGWPNAQPQGRD